MKRIAMVLAALLLAAGCGGSDANTPAVSSVTVTVMRNGVPQQGVSVVECTDMNLAVRPAEPVGAIDTKSTNASGQATFSVPASTSTGQLCFSVTTAIAGGYNHGDRCKTLNALSSVETVDLL